MDDPVTGGQIQPEERNLAAKWLLNGFPKSGLHLCVCMMRPLVRVMPAGQMHAGPWLGTFAGRSWTDEWTNVPLLMYQVGRLLPGHFFHAHMGHQDPIEWYLFFLGVAQVFIYRDPRDVAVSQAYHVTDPNDERFAHPDKDLYRALGGFDDVLEACIVGLDRYPGVMERWQYYAPWMSCDWVYLFQYERARTMPEVVAGEIIEYGLDRTSKIFGYRLRCQGPSFGNMVEQMVKSVDDTEYSPTYRKGGIGDWREHFTERHKRLFKQTDKQNWLVRLGYETSDDW